MGARNDGSTISDYFDGAIDDVKIYTRTLSVDEIRELAKSDGLAGHWQFENDVTDATGNNDGTAQGTPTYTSGSIYQAIQFDGTDDYVTMGDVLNPGDDSYTVSMWFKRDGTGQEYLAGKRSSGIPSGWSIHFDSSDRLTLTAGDGSDVGTIIGLAVTDTDWHHVALVIDRTSERAYGYLDGSIAGFTSDSLGGSNPIATTNDLVLGVRDDGTTKSDYFDGAIDDVKIYTRALDADEILVLSRQQDLVAHWRLDSNADDYAGSNDGTIYSATSYTTGATNLALIFDGTDDYVSMGDVLDPGDNSYTVSMWFKRDGIGQEYLAGKRSSGIPSGWSIHFDSSDRLTLTAGDGSDVGTIIGLAVTDTDWHHVALVIDRTSERAYGYLDGSIAGFTSDSLGGSNPIATTNDLVLGVRDDGTTKSDYFDGLLDDVKIYTKALRPVEILAMARQTDTYINFLDHTLSSYGTADEGYETYLDDGLTLKLDGDASKKIDLDYTITANTVIEFDFMSTEEGDVQGLGFDDDNTVTSTQIFQLYGLDIYGVQYYNDYTGSTWTHYTITVGDEYTGDMNFLTLLSTELGSSPDAVSYFSYLTIYEDV